MLAALRTPVSYAEYLRAEERSDVRHEWFDGQVFAMAGGTPEHAYLVNAVGAELRAALRGRPCRAFSSELRVRSIETGLATYPDAAVICGPVEPHPEDPHAATNPVVLVEVSPSEAARRLEHYQRFPSLRDYVLVATGRDHIDHSRSPSTRSTKGSPRSARRRRDRRWGWTRSSPASPTSSPPGTRSSGS